MAYNPLYYIKQNPIGSMNAWKGGEEVSVFVFNTAFRAHLFVNSATIV